jgi:hypothetical protein
MAIIEQIDKDFQQALKEKNMSAVSNLRLLSAALKYERIKKMADLVEDDAVRILKSEIKKRREAISDYEKGGRPELAAKEKVEIEFIEKYLPAQMSEDDVRAKVQLILQGIEDKENLGKVMGKVMAELKGQADGALVKKIVEELLK